MGDTVLFVLLTGEGQGLRGVRVGDPPALALWVHARSDFREGGPCQAS